MNTTVYTVTGMTCAHCTAVVTEELAQLPGVEDVAVELVVGGSSPVRVISASPLGLKDVREAVQEAGYELTEEAA